MAAAPRSTHVGFIVFGFLLILSAITHILYAEQQDDKLVITLVGLGFFVMLLSKWMLAKTGIVRVIRPYPNLGAGTVIVVLGFLLILAQITLHLMNQPVDEQVAKIVPAVAIVLMILGALIAGSGKERRRVADN